MFSLFNMTKEYMICQTRKKKKVRGGGGKEGGGGDDGDSGQGKKERE